MTSFDYRNRNKDTNDNVEFLTKDVKEIRKDGKVISIKVENRNFTKKLIVASVILIVIGISVIIKLM